jgi:hypothetical protein
MSSGQTSLLLLSIILLTDPEIGPLINNFLSIPVKMTDPRLVDMEPGGESTQYQHLGIKASLYSRQILTLFD